MNKLAFRSKVFFKKNSATILTCMGSAGVIATAVAAVKATPKALRRLEAAETAKGADLTTREIIQVAGPAYIPSVLIGAGTIVCIFGANILNKRQQAALMSAYALLDRSYKDYKHKVEELLGPDGVKEINAEIAKDKYKDADITVSNGKELFYDMFSQRYFESTMEDVQRAANTVNRNIVTKGYSFLNDFYKEIGIKELELGYKYGWAEGLNMENYWQSWVDFVYEKSVMDDGLECWVITMSGEPIYDFENYFDNY